jgi:hypothetical protein
VFLRGTVLAFVLVASWALAPMSGASAAVVNGDTVSQCNGIDNVGGEAVRCTVTITNTSTASTVDGTVTTVSSAVFEECRGAAGAELLCTRTTGTGIAFVDQCNGSTNGGGSTLECHVDVTNTFINIDMLAPSPVSVNQCVDAGQDGGTEPTTVCRADSPLVVTAGAAFITQCNEAGNGGGGTERVQCSVDSDSTAGSTSGGSRIRQCVGSGNGGGSTVTCTASYFTNVVPPVDEPPVDEPPVDEPPVDEPPVDEPPVDEPPVDEPPVDQPPVDQPPLVYPPVGNPPLVFPPAVNPPAVNPPVVNPPVVNPPVVTPPVFRANPPAVVTSPPGRRSTPPDQTLQRLPRTGVDSGWLLLTSALLVSAGSALFSLSSRMGRRSTST